MANVMVVDDNSELADNLVEILDGEGHQAIAAYNGGDALRCAEAFDYGLALVDIKLPDMSGPSLVERLLAIKAHGSYAFMTAYCGSDLVQRAAALTQHAVFDKPLDVGRLLRIVARATPAHGMART